MTAVKGKIYKENKRAIKRHASYHYTDVIGYESDPSSDDNEEGGSSLNNKRIKKRRRRDYDDDEYDDNKNNVNAPNDTTNMLPPIVPNPMLKPLPIPSSFGNNISTTNSVSGSTTNSMSGSTTTPITGSATAQILSALHSINQALNEHKEQMQVLSTRLDSMSDTFSTSNAMSVDNTNNSGSLVNNQTSKPLVIDDNDGAEDEYHDDESDYNDDNDIDDLEIPPL